MKDDALFDTRTLITIIVVVGAVTGGNIWINRNNPPLGFNRFEGYGFSIDYRRDMYFEVTGLGEGSATESIGTVQGVLEYESLEQFGVMWVSQQNLPSHLEDTPEGALEYVHDLIEMSGTQISERGEMQTGSKDGHDMTYQTFEVDLGSPVRGIVGAWYCDEVGKYLMLFLIHMPDVAQPQVLSQEVESKWMGYLDSLICH
jgi:hypothetical protein